MDLSFFLAHSKPLSELAQAVALACAALYFAWKLATGYLFVNLTVELKTTRTQAYVGRDYLVTEIRLSKGDRASLLLKEVTVFVQAGDYPQRSEGLTSPKIPSGRRMIRLTPGESTVFSHSCQIPSHCICLVEVHIAGRSDSPFTGHWKASTCSAPIAGNA